MVSYTDIARFASEAYMNALLDNAQDAKEAAAINDEERKCYIGFKSTVEEITTAIPEIMYFLLLNRNYR